MNCKPTYTPAPDRYAPGMMPYRQCGHSGLRLPALSLGFWWHYGDINPYSEARHRVLYAFDHGITCFDLANNYGPPYGSAEETFGRIMADDLRPYRHEMVVTTKAGYDMWPGPYGEGSSRKMLMTSIDESLRRMRLDYVDIFYSHRYDPGTPIEETTQALIDIVRSGKAMYVGLSNYPAPQLAEAAQYLAAQHVHPLIYQGKYSMLVRDVEQEHIDLLGRLGMGMTAFSPLAEGLLTDKYLHGIPAGSRAALGHHLKAQSITPQVLDRVAALNQVAAQRGQTLAQMATAWLLAQKGVTSVIIGPRTVEQLADSLKAAQCTDFDARELSTIDKILNQ